jgi:hypothetical protein
MNKHAKPAAPKGRVPAFRYKLIEGSVQAKKALTEDELDALEDDGWVDSPKSAQEEKAPAPKPKPAAKPAEKKEPVEKKTPALKRKED